MRTLAVELAQPKYSHIERERRWTVNGSALPDLDNCTSLLIEDRYIDGSRMRLRRMTDECSGEISLKLSKKYDAGSSDARPLVTAYLDAQEYELLLALPGANLAKRRFHVPHEGREWSLDLFIDPHEGLALLEIEAEEHELQTLVPPPFATKEITDDERYACGSLVRSHQLPE